MTENSSEISNSSQLQVVDSSRIFFGWQLNFEFPEWSHIQDNVESALTAEEISSASAKQFQAVVLK